MELSLYTTPTIYTRITFHMCRDYTPALSRTHHRLYAAQYQSSLVRSHVPLSAGWSTTSPLCVVVTIPSAFEYGEGGGLAACDRC